MTTEKNGDAATAMKLLLRDDLRAAMAGKRSAEVAVLRTLLGAFDQAEAVAVAVRGHEYARFGDPGVEVARKRLSAEEVRAVVRRERDELLSAAEEYAGLGQADAATAFALKAEILARYLGPA